MCIVLDGWSIIHIRGIRDRHDCINGEDENNSRDKVVIAEEIIYSYLLILFSTLHTVVHQKYEYLIEWARSPFCNRNAGDENRTVCVFNYVVNMKQFNGYWAGYQKCVCARQCRKLIVVAEGRMDYAEDYLNGVAVSLSDQRNECYCGWIALMGAADHHVSRRSHSRSSYCLHFQYHQ